MFSDCNLDGFYPHTKSFDVMPVMHDSSLSLWRYDSVDPTETPVRPSIQVALAKLVLRDKSMYSKHSQDRLYSPIYETQRKLFKAKGGGSAECSDILYGHLHTGPNVFESRDRIGSSPSTQACPFGTLTDLSFHGGSVRTISPSRATMRFVTRTG